MKWYKKQLDQLRKAKAKSSSSDNEAVGKKTPGHSFDAKKLRNKYTNLRSPVAESKLARPKTDVH